MKNILAKNKRACYDYEILETFEAGLILIGNEVKSIRMGNISLKTAFISIKTPQNTKKQNPEFFLVNAHISPYQRHVRQHNPKRPRKLLLHAKEISSLIGKIKTKGLTLIPISVYNRNSKIKLELALVRGKKKVDKRESLKKRETDREIRRKMKTSVP